tara:strand:+ start:129 stop:1325 length:1197 start_codon:yes stop_codon:yes gene_type:complete
MEEIISSIMQAMPNVNKPQQKFMTQLFTALATFVGKATYRNLNRYSDLNEKTISRWFRRVFDFLKFNNLLLQRLITSKEKISAIDASYLKKSGKKTNGLGMFWNGQSGKAEKGLEVSLISIIDRKSNTAYALDARQTIDVDNQTRVDFYSIQVENCAPTLLDQGIKYMAADALYSKHKFINRVCATGLELVGKLRCDSELYWKYNGSYGGIGRPKEFNGKVNFENDLTLFDHVKRLDDGTEIYTSIVHSKTFKRNLRIVLMRHAKEDGTKISHVILYSTDVNLDPLTIIEYYQSRFQIEFVFRDAKQHTGLSDCQSTNSKSIHSHLNASFTALNLIKLEDRITSGVDTQKVISIASWKRLKFNQHYMKLLFCHLGLELKQQKILYTFNKFSNYGAIFS